MPQGEVGECWRGSPWDKNGASGAENVAEEGNEQ